jgi:hypothetical protein
VRGCIQQGDPPSESALTHPLPICSNFPPFVCSQCRRASVVVDPKRSSATLPSGAALAVPPGATAAPFVAIVAMNVTTGGGDAATGVVVGEVAQLLPEGTNFSTPAELTLPAPPPSSVGKLGYVIQWLNETSGLWEDASSPREYAALPVGPAGGRVVRAALSHFSIYRAVARPETPPPTRSLPLLSLIAIMGPVLVVCGVVYSRRRAKRRAGRRVQIST